jgi:hypothetical protein
MLAEDEEGRRKKVKRKFSVIPGSRLVGDWSVGEGVRAVGPRSGATSRSCCVLRWLGGADGCCCPAKKTK